MAMWNRNTQKFQQLTWIKAFEEAAAPWSNETESKSCLWCSALDAYARVNPGLHELGMLEFDRLKRTFDLAQAAAKLRCLG